MALSVLSKQSAGVAASARTFGVVFLANLPNRRKVLVSLTQVFAGILLDVGNIF